MTVANSHLIHDLDNESRLLKNIVDLVHPGDIHLDLGIGMGGLYAIKLAEKLRGDSIAESVGLLFGVEAHMPYLVRKAWPANVRLVCSPILDFLEHFDTRDIINSATAIDVIEHFEMGDALHVINRMKMIAHTVALFVPDGDHPQDSDGHGMGGDWWQKHRSTWNRELLESLNFVVEDFKDFHTTKNPSAPHALWAVWHDANYAEELKSTKAKVK